MLLTMLCVVLSQHCVNEVIAIIVPIDCVSRNFLAFYLNTSLPWDPKWYTGVGPTRRPPSGSVERTFLGGPCMGPKRTTTFGKNQAF